MFNRWCKTLMSSTKGRAFTRINLHNRLQKLTFFLMDSLFFPLSFTTFSTSFLSVSGINLVPAAYLIMSLHVFVHFVLMFCNFKFRVALYLDWLLLSLPWHLNSIHAFLLKWMQQTWANFATQVNYCTFCTNNHYAILFIV